MVGAAENGRVWEMGRLDDFELSRLPPPPILDAAASERSERSADRRLANDVAEMGGRLLAGVKGGDVLAPDGMLDDGGEGALGMMLEPLRLA